MFNWLAKKMDDASIKTRLGTTLQRRTYEWTKLGYSDEDAERHAKNELYAAMRAAEFNFSTWSPQAVDEFCEDFLQTPIGRSS